MAKERIEKVEKELKHEEFGKMGIENVLCELRTELQEKKMEVEKIRGKLFKRIPAQFLASQKLAMDKKKYSPKKLNENVVVQKRSNSITK